MKIAKLVAFLAVFTVPSAFGDVIDFETGAPCCFVDTTPLTTLYSGLGVTFGGNPGGSILDQSGIFGINAHSGSDFLGFSTEAFPPAFATGNSESISFAAPISDVGLWAGGAIDGTSYTLQAFDSAKSLIASVSVDLAEGVWDQLVINGDGISSLELTFSNNPYGAGVVDDLSWSGNATAATPEPSTLLLTAAVLIFVLSFPFGFDIVAKATPATSREQSLPFPSRLRAGNPNQPGLEWRPGRWRTRRRWCSIRSVNPGLCGMSGLFR